MNRLDIETRDGKFYVECNGRSFSCDGQSIASVLETACIEIELKGDALRHLSTLFNEMNAERVSLGGAGEWWYATATIPVVKNYTNNYYDVESYDPFSALAALETAIRNGWDDESGLNAIDRFLTWSWFV